MKSIRLIVAVLLLSAAAQPLAQTADVALRAAMEKETVDGDLRGAIEAYKRIVDGYRDNRAVRAKALLRMAECYRKLGDAQAVEIYRRIVREFADQTEQAAVARSRVGQSAPAARPTGELMIRRLDAGLDLWVDDISPDGTRVAFTDWTTGNLSIRDIHAKRVFRLTSHPLPANGMFTEFGMSPVFSPDGSHVAYTWCVLSGNGCNTTLRISRVGENEGQNPRAAHVAGLWIRAYDWSPDAKQLAVVNARGCPDAGDQCADNDIALMDIETGAIRTLLALGERPAPFRMAFSADGRHLAFDAIAADGDNRGRRDVFILPVAGGAARAVSATAGYRMLAGWSPDGQRLLFTSDNRGAIDLHAMAVTKGQPQEPALLIKADLGMVTPLRIGPSGTLFYATDTGGGTRVKHAVFDFKSGALAVSPVSMDDQLPGTNTGPQWSPDGQWLAFVHRRKVTPQSRATIVIRPKGTGEAREVALDLIRVDQPRWGPDGRLLYTLATSARGAAGLYRIDLTTGGTTLLAAGDALRHLRLTKDGTVARFVRTTAGRHRFVEFDLRNGTEKEIFRFETAGNPAPPQVSADGTRVFYRRALAGAAGTSAPDVLVERDLATGTERELLKGRIPFALLSPDARHVGVRRVDPDGKWVAVSVVATTGEPVVRDLVRIEHPSGATVVAWSPDGGSLLINRPGSNPADVDETWWVPLDNRTPRKLDQSMTNIHIHPDGRTLTFQVANSQPSRSDVWAMEHFLGRAGATRRPGVR